MKTTHAMILAAGFGSRLQAKEGHKLLVELGGRTLLEHHLVNFEALGVTDITCVTGFKHEALEAAIVRTTQGRDIRVHTAYNPDFEGSNGLSVLTGMAHAQAPFWLTMADHVFDPALFDNIHAPQGVEGALFVDAKLDSIYDMPDATKVNLGPDGELLAIGKEIPEFNVVDVGLFWCGPGFVQALELERDARGDCSTSDAVRRLSEQGTFAFPDIGAATWQDVDTPGARAHAEKLHASWNA